MPAHGNIFVTLARKRCIAEILLFPSAVPVHFNITSFIDTEREDKNTLRNMVNHAGEDNHPSARSPLVLLGWLAQESTTLHKAASHAQHMNSAANPPSARHAEWLKHCDCHMLRKRPSNYTLHEQCQQPVACVVVLILLARLSTLADSVWGVDPLSRKVTRTHGLCVQLIYSPAAVLLVLNFGTLLRFPILLLCNRANLHGRLTTR